MKYSAFFNINDKFTNPFLIACDSILRNSTLIKNIEILHSDLTDESKARISKLCAEYNTPVNFIHFQNKEAQKLKAPLHVSNETFFRLFMQEYTTEDLVAYFDADLVVLKNIDEYLQYLDRLDKEDKYITGVQDTKVDPAYKGKISGIPNFYYNAGVMLYNLGKMRRENITAKVNEMMESGQIKNFTWADQDVVNYLFAKKSIELPQKYNCPLNKYNEDTVILHFIGGQKPWQLDYKDKKTLEVYKKAAGKYFFTESASDYRKRSFIKRLKNTAVKWKKKLGL